MDLVCELQAWALFEASQQKVQKMRSLFKQALKVDPENMHSLQVCRFHPQFIVMSFKCRKSVGTSLYVFSTFHHSSILRQYLLGFSNQSRTYHVLQAMGSTPCFSPVGRAFIQRDFSKSNAFSM
jgi:hypothetical protein